MALGGWHSSAEFEDFNATPRDSNYRNQTGTYVGGGDFRSLNPALNRAETALEFTYLVTPLPWLSVQPDVQYILDPSTDGAVEDALVVGFRLQIAL